MSEQEMEDTAFETEFAIRARQQAPLREAMRSIDPKMSLIAEKAAMFDELVEAIALFCEYEGGLARVIAADSLLIRARELQKP